MRRALLLALLVLPLPAAAGTEADPEVDDHPDEEDPTLDLLAAWLENRPDGVRVHVKVGRIDANGTDRAYLLGFSIGNRTSLALVAVDGEGALRSYVGPNAPGAGGAPPESLANDGLADAALAAGAPGVASATIPWGAVPGLEPGAVLADLEAGTAAYQRARGRWADVDLREGSRNFTAERVLLAPGTERTFLLLGGAGALLGLGLAGGFALARLRRD